MKKRILVVCKDNSFLSKVGEGFLKKFGGHWKEIESGGVHTNSQSIPDSTLNILKEHGLTDYVDHIIRNIDNFQLVPIDYIVVLSSDSSLMQVCKDKFPVKEIIQIPIEIGTHHETVSAIEKECLQFVKSGPIKRWLTE